MPMSVEGDAKLVIDGDCRLLQKILSILLTNLNRFLGDMFRATNFLIAITNMDNNQTSTTILKTDQFEN